MYAHNFLVSSVRGSGFEPTTSDSAASGVTGFMKAALGFRLLADFFAMSSPSDRRSNRSAALIQLAPIMNILRLEYQRQFAASARSTERPAVRPAADSETQHKRDASLRARSRI